MAGGRARKRKPSASLVDNGASPGSSMAPSPPREHPESTAVDTDSLDCGVCFLPLKPPIFQCAVGHVVCSACCDRLKAAGKCHVCGVALAGGGYRRCHAMERVVDSARAPCPHARHGCDARPAYHAREEHLRECPHAPCHCPAGDFAGSTEALLDHVAGAHCWPCVNEPRHRATKSRPSFRVALRDGFNFVASAAAADDERGGRHLFLLNVVRHPFCRAVSVLCVRPRAAAAATGVKFVLEHQCSLADPLHVRHEQRAVFRAVCSDLSDGLPDPSESYQLIVPERVDGERQSSLMVKVRILSK